MVKTLKEFTGHARFSLDIRPLQMSSRYQGTGVYGYNLVRHLMKIDAENEYFLFQTRKSPWRELPYPSNFRSFPVRRFYEQDQRFAPFLDPILSPLDLVRLRPDLHHAFSIHYVPWRLPCPRVVTILDVIPLVFAEHYTQTGLKHRMLYRFARGADHILTLSEHARRDVHRLLRIPLDRITVTHEAADDRFQPADDPALVEEVIHKYGIRRPYILYVGGFTKWDPRKNVKHLVEVFRELRAEGAREVRLVLAGKLGDYSRALMQEMGGLDPASGVVFTDYVDDADLPSLYNGARCFVFPSAYEGFGLPVLEAISCGTPTVAYRNSSIPEVVGDAGILIDDRQPGQLLEAIRTLLASDALVGELRAKGLDQAKRFRWEDTARKTLAVYRDVCASKGRNPKRSG
ncbi:MAG: glycosyltransferase family 4 protein [Thermodesulfobacteriota bacterium]